MKSRSGPKFTPQQQAAISTRGVSVALSAGAGCGKTFVLTQRFLAGLEALGDVNSLQSLVAITFTDRAAREMRDRIRSACHQRLHEGNADEADHWLAVLRGLDSARISTIHSYCAGLLRSHAIEAGLDPRFSVMEPEIADTLLRNTTRQTLYRLLERTDNDADELVLKFGLERSRILLQVLTLQRFQMAFEKFESLSTAEIADGWRARWQAEFVPRLISSLRTSAAVTRVVDLLRENVSTHATMKERRTILLDWLSPETSWNNPLQALAVVRESARVQGTNASAWSSVDVFEAIKHSLSNLRDAIKKLELQLPIDEDDLNKAAEFSARALRLAKLSTDAYEDAKHSQGLLDFDDLLLRARDLLRSNSAVRERVVRSIQLLMVDEFQDTDPVQTEIVQMLCGDALTSGRLFLVGDAKQSIYRFRRADPGVFHRLRQQIPQGGQLPLSINFRSQPAILNFVNHLFAEGMPDTYEPLTPFDERQHSPTPAIEFLFASHDAPETPARRSKGTAASHSRRNQATAGELREREADWIARRCAELLADPTERIRETDDQGQAKLRRVEPGDIVILFRALSNVQEYEAALRRFDLDYYLVGGKAFFAQQEVFDLLNLCRYLDDPDDLIGLVGILRSPMFSLSDDSLQALVGMTDSEPDLFGTNRRRTLHDGLMMEPPSHLAEEQRWRISNARNVLTELRAQRDRVPLAKLLNLAVERTGYDAALLTEFLGSRKVANLRKLVEMAAEFDRSELFTLKDFVERLQTSVLAETDEEFATTLPETGEVIRLMSIHQSKGLEFPVVIVADIDRKRPPTGKPAVLHPELGALVKLPDAFGKTYQNLGLKMFEILEKEADDQETIRLFYVACTRARDYLILSTGIEIDSTRRAPWLELVESRFDIRTGHLKIDPWLGSSPHQTAGRETIPDIRVHPAPAVIKSSPHSSQNLTPINRLAERIHGSEAGEIPVLAARIGRDTGDLAPLSVSLLESIDAQRMGIGHIPSDRATDWAESIADPDQATVLGTLIHAVLERIDFGRPESWSGIMQSVVGSTRDLIHEDTVSLAGKLIARLLESKIAGELASAKNLYREMEFTFLWKDPAGLLIPVRGIIDLLYEDLSGGWHVLDYKTNNFPASASDEQLLAPYEFQLAVYAHAVTEWLGESPRELALLGMRPAVRTVRLPWSNERWESMRSRIQASIDEYRIKS